MNLNMTLLDTKYT